MRTVDSRIAQGESRWGRIVRDVRLLRRIARMLWNYFVAGRRIRKRYRETAARGEVFWVDEDLRT